MALPSPTVAMPEMGRIREQALAHAGDLAQAAWVKMTQANDARAMPEARSFGSMQGSAYGNGMEAWGNRPPQVSGSEVQVAYQGNPSKDQEIYNNRLRELGVPEHVIEGNAWNVQDESNWNFGAVGDSGASFGVNQWYGPRKEELFAFAKSKGMSPAHPVVQADNWFREMNGPYSEIYQQAVQSGNPTGAAVAILNGYEIPAEEHRLRREAAYKARQAAASQFSPNIPAGSGFSLGLAQYGS